MSSMALLQADGCIWHEGEQADNENATLMLGAKGLLCVEMDIRTASVDLPSEHGAIAPNALWRLLWALNSLKDAREEVLVEGFYDNLVPAADDMVEILRTMPDNAQALAQQWGVKQMLSGLEGFQLHYTHLLIPTCTINGISGSGMLEALSTSLSTVIPAQARARVDFHLVPDQDPHDIFAKLQCHLQAQGFGDVQVRMLYACQPAYTPLADPFVQMVRRATTSAYEREPRILPMTIGSHPIAPLRHLGMPVVITTGGALAQDSSARAKDFAAQIKQIALVIEEFAHGTDPVA
ncbi:MAG: peptidase dimerization domain-containing protein [Chloroflexi bacterium]|nr:peptidase dimerization domain-containing protein [Chloroflexota bacterium]